MAWKVGSVIEAQRTPRSRASSINAANQQTSINANGNEKGWTYSCCRSTGR